MTLFAGFGRGFIEQDRLSIYFALQGMALRAFHVFVPASQWELGALVVIERRRLPTLNHVTIRARSHAFLILVRELPPVWVAVASIAILRGPLELDVMRAGRSFVAFAAGHDAMRSGQVEFRFRMVKTLDVDPCFGIVAGLTTQRSSIRAS